ncbi:MAG: 1-acyl-sn-glycerol-3-phosphate acyltransferase [Acidobacteria bacterium]|jgi:1-acyl-sn-glycerol-3-phosphate acyltransferase|nr:1-acyl-sn-glycerol-3-phosphate acyltransferase [Acidobacteriota bacterium]
MFRATLVYLFIGLYVLVAAPVGMLWALLSRDSRLLFRLARVCILSAGWIGGIRVEVKGKENVGGGQPYLFLSNHRGNLDGPILVHATRRDCRAIIKKEIMRIPILGWVLRIVDFVPVDRKDPIHARASIDRAAQLLKAGFSFFAFPEGTRSRDGSLGPFKKGVFVMAIQSGIPVLPVSIRNTAAIQPPGSYGIRPGRVEVIFHEPIRTNELRLEDRDRLLQLTREAIARGL